MDRQARRQPPDEPGARVKTRPDNGPREPSPPDQTLAHPPRGVGIQAIPGERHPRGAARERAYLGIGKTIDAAGRIPRGYRRLDKKPGARGNDQEFGLSSRGITGHALQGIPARRRHPDHPRRTAPARRASERTPASAKPSTLPGAYPAATAASTRNRALVEMTRSSGFPAGVSLAMLFKVFPRGVGIQTIPGARHPRGARASVPRHRQNHRRCRAHTPRLPPPRQKTGRSWK